MIHVTKGAMWRADDCFIDGYAFYIGCVDRMCQSDMSVISLRMMIFSFMFCFVLFQPNLLALLLCFFDLLALKVEPSVGYWAKIGSLGNDIIILPVGCWDWKELGN